MAAPTLVPLFTLTADVVTKGVVPNGPQGTRVVVEASTGTFEGERLRGTVSGPGGDWVTVRADGSLRLDVRLLLHTDDGAVIYMEYRGIGLDGAKRITTAPLFETGDERYAWLNHVQAVARGASADGKVTYEVYEVA